MEKARALLAMSSKEKERILNYQGSYATIDELYKWQNSELVVYGNHLFNHWNLKSLTKSEIVEEYNKNQEILDSFPNSINLFAFPNGVPGICFTDTELKVIQELGPKKVLSSVNGINRNLDNFLLGRVSFSHTDITPTDFWFRVFRDHTKSHYGQNAY
jgi:peptidoglycan/xylan/chitin deacetylase (PgdA/CDA1 family)